MTDAATQETAPAADTLGLDGAARAIERILTGEAPRRRRGGVDAERVRDESPDDGGQAPVTDDRSADPNGAEDGAAEPEDEGRAEDEGALYAVKLDGEEQRVTLDELVRGYQRNADYTRKTMKLAEERRELAELRRDAEQQRARAEAERRQYTTELDSAIPMLREQLLKHFGGIDWAKLAAEEPQRFAELAPAFETLSGQLQQAEAMRHRLRQQQRQTEAEVQQARLRYRNEQWRALVRHLPELAEPAAARREVLAMTEYLTEAGYSREELDRLVDHRDFILARKAMLYDRMAGSKGKVEERVRALPKVQRPGVAASRRDGRQERRAALMNRLRRSGSTEDAARAIEELL